MKKEMPYCVTCAELENPNWRDVGHLKHKKISWSDYWWHKIKKNLRKHDSYW
jgi:hypothetical protein